MRVVCCVCLLAASLAGAGCRSGGIRVRSWDEAISFALNELEKAGDLESRLEGYAQTAANLSQSIDTLDQTRPALELIGQLRDVNVPLLGNGWRILLALLSLATVDGAKIIAKLEHTLRTLTELKTSLDDQTRLPAVANAVRAFRSDPNQRTLVALSATSTTTTSSLSQLHADLGDVLDPLKDVAGNLSGLVKGLRGAADIGIPFVSDAARPAAENIGNIEEPLLRLRDGLDQLHQDIETDIKVLENIQEAVRQAREHGGFVPPSASLRGPGVRDLETRSESRIHTPKENDENSDRWKRWRGQDHAGGVAGDDLRRGWTSGVGD